MANGQIRPIRIDGNRAYVPLTKGYEAAIDVADVPLVEGFNWRAQIARRPDGSIRSVYAVRWTPREYGHKWKMIWMHRVVSAPADGLEVDHIDADGLNNTRGNLRQASRSENGRNTRLSLHNTSGHKGVYFSKRLQKWAAGIKINGRAKHLGLFNCVTAAAVAYAKASRDIHGAFGRAA